MTEYLFAPMEGITYSLYRSLHRRMFPGAAEYYTPFIAPDTRGSFKPKYLKDLTGDSEDGCIIPQLLANSAEAFNITADKLHMLGFRTINLNVGCPSGTVFSKHKGAGMLTDLDHLNAFLDQVFSHAQQQGLCISIKTRMGVQSPEEFPEILEIYNRYPLSKLIIHARSRNGYYKSLPDLEGFAAAAERSAAPVCYNGNLFSAADRDKVRSRAPAVECFMPGRGVVANPALIRVLQGGPPLRTDELKEFHDRLLEGWLSSGLQPNFAVERMKTLWTYMQVLFPGERKKSKAILKAKGLEGYRYAVAELLQSAEETEFLTGTYSGSEAAEKMGI